MVICVGGGLQINREFKRRGIPRDFGPLGRRNKTFREKQLARNILEKNQIKVQDFLAKKGITAVVIIPVLDLGSVLCHVNGDTLVEVAYIGFDDLFVITTEVRKADKEKDFGNLRRVQVIGFPKNFPGESVNWNFSNKESCGKPSQRGVIACLKEAVMFKTWKDFVGKTIAVLVSGGLDSTAIIKWMTEKGIRVIAITVDFAQPDENDLSDIPRRMKAAGAVEAYLIDGKAKLAEYMLKVIQGLACYDGRYMLTTSIARMAAVAVALPTIRKVGADAVSHGSTGKGNDQIRFELALAALAPDLEMYVPWRDQSFIDELGGRPEMIHYCENFGLVISATLEQPYSTDANFAGLTHEAGILEKLTTATSAVKFVMGNSPFDAPDKKTRVKIIFKAGRPVAVNDVEMNLEEIFLTLNAIAGENAIGIGLDQIENRVLGLKSRGIYESPGVTLVFIAYLIMVGVIIDDESRLYLDITSRMFAKAVYGGNFFHPVSAMLQAAIASAARFITGHVTLDLYKGTYDVVEIDGGPNCLYCEEKASMDKKQENLHVWSQGWVAWAADTVRNLAAAGQTGEA